MGTFWIAIIIFVVAYLLIIFDIIPAATAAFIGGIAMVGTRIITEEEAFGSIDMEVIFLLVGMMIIVHIMSETGVFQWIAIKMAQFVKGNPFSMMVLLIIVTAVFSAFLDNVTTILLIVPVSILLAEQLELDPMPFLLTEAFASNIGGTATLIGDPPNILIGTAANINFNEFLLNLSPLIIVNTIVLIATVYFIFGRKFKVSRDLKARIMELDSSRALKDKKLLVKSTIVMLCVIAGFLLHPFIGLGPAVIAMFGAMVLVVWAKKKPEDILAHVEWDTLFFFMGLFILVEGVVQVGLLKIVAAKALQLTGGSLKVTSMLILWMSGTVSAIVNNIPYAATIIPMIRDELIPNLSALHPEVAQTQISYMLWWALSLGACLGGNATIVGASANVVAVGIASKSGRNITFMRFAKYGVIITLESMILSTIYLLLFYVK